MPLGLAKDSMINLAEMAAEKPESSKNTIEGEVDEEMVMQVATHNIAKDRASLILGGGGGGGGGDGVPLGEFARDSLGQFSAEDDSNDLAELERLVRAQEAAQAAGGDISRSSSIGSDDAALRFVDDMDKQEKDEEEAEEEKSSTSYGKYAGFAADYTEYDSYADPGSYTSYAFKRSSVIDVKSDGSGKTEGGLWCCLFPWIGGPSQEELEYQKWKDQYSGVPSQAAAPMRSPSKDDDSVSTGSGVFGEKLSAKDRQAVLARLRLAQPDPAVSGTNPSESTDAVNKEKGKGLLNGIVSPKDGGSMRSILRRPSTFSQLGLNKLNNQSSESSYKDGKQKKRRSLFPAYEVPKEGKKNLHVEFADMARVMTVKSHKEMDEGDKADVWWQRSDYDEFRRTGRMIVRAMLEGGSEIWLATSQSWQMPNQGRQTTLKNALSLSEQKKAFEKGDINAKRQYEAARDKWWHTFGHSRRGLEHIASIDEGRQRQGNVRTAVKSVVDEQWRQKAFRRDDPEKLRMVSIQHSSWARDLALAAGASDADVLRQNFDDSNRRSREFYLLKFSRTQSSNSAPTESGKVVPAFMRPVMPISVGPNRMDVNTLSSIKFRNAQTKKATPKPPTLVKPLSAESRESMAKQAAGYASGKEGLNMSAVLTGMGALPAEAATAGGP
jgi:hypothetical protein